ncbi:hypothetical protein Ae201684P_019046 [Aphanomyces euteiches]|nr:hypothetical protein Ae201684P_019046 [Aphanomyces euteiches]
MQLAQFLLEKLNNGRLPHGTIKEAAAKFECDRKTVRMFFQRMSRDGISGVGSSRKKGRVGRKKLVSDDEAITRIRAAFASLHPEDRSIYQSWVDQIVHQYRPSSSSFEANASALSVCDLGAVLDEYFEAHEDHETNLAALCDDSHFDDISVDRLVDMMNDLEVHVDA